MTFLSSYSMYSCLLFLTSYASVRFLQYSCIIQMHFQSRVVGSLSPAYRWKNWDSGRQSISGGRIHTSAFPWLSGRWSYHPYLRLGNWGPERLKNMPGLLNYEALEPVCYSEAHELSPGSLSSLRPWTRRSSKVCFSALLLEKVPDRAPCSHLLCAFWSCPRKQQLGLWATQGSSDAKRMVFLNLWSQQTLTCTRQGRIQSQAEIDSSVGVGGWELSMFTKWEKRWCWLGEKCHFQAAKKSINI